MFRDTGEPQIVVPQDAAEKSKKVPGLARIWLAGMCVAERLFLTSGRQRLASRIQPAAESGVEQGENARLSFHNTQQGPPTGPRVETSAGTTAGAARRYVLSPPPQLRHPVRGCL